MTYLQRRIAELREMIPASMEAGTLPILHDQLLSHAPHLRLKTRWGNYSEYSLAIRDKDAVEITNGNAVILPDGQSRWRIRFGARFFGDELETYVLLETWHPKPVNEWRVYEDPTFSSERVWEWLRKEQPAAEPLLEIDMLLLR